MSSQQKKKIHCIHPNGGVVCDHKDHPSYTEKTDDTSAVTCLKCLKILNGEFGGRPFKLKPPE